MAMSVALRLVRANRDVLADQGSARKFPHGYFEPNGFLSLRLSGHRTHKNRASIAGPCAVSGPLDQLQVVRAVGLDRLGALGLTGIRTRGRQRRKSGRTVDGVETEWTAHEAEVCASGCRFYDKRGFVIQVDRTVDRRQLDDFRPEADLGRLLP